MPSAILHLLVGRAFVPVPYQTLIFVNTSLALVFLVLLTFLILGQALRERRAESGGCSHKMAELPKDDLW